MAARQASRFPRYITAASLPLALAAGLAAGRAEAGENMLLLEPAPSISFQVTLGQLVDWVLNPTPQRTRRSIVEYLEEVAPNLDCRFTLERFVPRRPWAPDEWTTRLYRTVESDPAPVASLEALGGKLRELLPGVRVVPDGTTPNIIHLIDDRLVALRGYALDEKASIRYTGLLESLPPLLSPRIRAPSFFIVGGGPCYWDETTRITVRADGVPIRQIMTDCMPWRTYSRVLWSADMQDLPGGPTTDFTFYGPAPHPTLGLLAPDR